MRFFFIQNRESEVLHFYHKNDPEQVGDPWGYPEIPICHKGSTVVYTAPLEEIPIKFSRVCYHCFQALQARMRKGISSLSMAETERIQKFLELRNTNPYIVAPKSIEPIKMKAFQRKMKYMVELVTDDMTFLAVCNHLPVVFDSIPQLLESFNKLSKSDPNEPHPVAQWVSNYCDDAIFVDAYEELEKYNESWDDVLVRAIPVLLDDTIVVEQNATITFTVGSE